MTEQEATQLLVSAAALAAQLAALIPTLVQNFQSIKDGLATDDLGALNLKIASVHGEIQALDAQLQALQGGSV